MVAWDTTLHWSSQVPLLAQGKLLHWDILVWEVVARDMTLHWSSQAS